MAPRPARPTSSSSASARVPAWRLPAISSGTDVLPRGQRRQEVKELEDEADALAANRASVISDIAVMSAPSTDAPVDGESSPAISPSSVDLPLPDGPVIATTPAGVDAQVERMQDREHRVAARDCFRNSVQLDHEPPAASTIGLRAVHSVSATIAVFLRRWGCIPSD